MDIIQFFKDQLQANPSRVAGYVSSAVLAGALQLGRLLGVDIPSDVQAGIIVVSGFLTTELIRRFVYSPKTTQAIADRAADTGNTDIGSPPTGK
jgi:hypothetical protein